MISIHNSAYGDGVTYASGGSKALFNLADDGRFAYAAAAGYVFGNAGVELKYINLGQQHMIGVNGSPLEIWENGSFSGSFIGINAYYFVPINNGKQDLFVSIGEGSLRTKFTTTQKQPIVFSSTGTMHAPQSEAALLLGGGVRFHVSPAMAVNLEFNRITPNIHGHVNSGIYNVAFNVVSAGLIVTLK